MLENVFDVWLLSKKCAHETSFPGASWHLRRNLFDYGGAFFSKMCILFTKCDFFCKMGFGLENVRFWSSKIWPFLFLFFLNLVLPKFVLPIFALPIFVLPKFVPSYICSSYFCASYFCSFLYLSLPIFVLPIFGASYVCVPINGPSFIWFYV